MNPASENSVVLILDPVSYERRSSGIRLKLWKSKADKSKIFEIKNTAQEKMNLSDLDIFIEKVLVERLADHGRATENQVYPIRFSVIWNTVTVLAEHVLKTLLGHD